MGGSITPILHHIVTITDLDGNQQILRGFFRLRRQTQSNAGLTFNTDNNNFPFCRLPIGTTVNVGDTIESEGEKFTAINVITITAPLRHLKVEGRL